MVPFDPGCSRAGTTELRDAGRSLFCFEGAASPAACFTIRQNGHTQDRSSISSRLCVMYRSLETCMVFDAAFENCIASTSVLKEVLFRHVSSLPRET
jgi:hypothetical protein